MSEDKVSTPAESRWSAGKRSDKVRRFLEDFTELCDRHGIYVGHEDQHGAFVLVGDADPEERTFLLEWMYDAATEDLEGPSE